MFPVRVLVATPTPGPLDLLLPGLAPRCNTSFVHLSAARKQNLPPLLWNSIVSTRHLLWDVLWWYVPLLGKVSTQRQKKRLKRCSMLILFWEACVLVKNTPIFGFLGWMAPLPCFKQTHKTYPLFFSQRGEDMLPAHNSPPSALLSSLSKRNAFEDDKLLFFDLPFCETCSILQFFFLLWSTQTSSPRLEKCVGYAKQRLLLQASQLDLQLGNQAVRFDPARAPVTQ